MTKTQLAQAIVDETEEENIYSCGCRGVAMETLDLLTKEEVQYTSGRGGVGFKQYKHLFPDEIRMRADEFTCLRDVLAALPG